MANCKDDFALSVLDEAEELRKVNKSLVVELTQAKETIQRLQLRLKAVREAANLLYGDE